MQKQTLPDDDDIIGECVKLIWNKYDPKGNGYLDREQCYRFLVESMSENQGEHHSGSLERDWRASYDLDYDNRDNISRKEFEEIFSRIDKDGSGLIDKDEMLLFVK